MVKIVLGGNDNAADNYAIDAQDVVAEDDTPGLATGQNFTVFNRYRS